MLYYIYGDDRIITRRLRKKKKKTTEVKKRGGKICIFLFFCIRNNYVNTAGWCQIKKKKESPDKINVSRHSGLSDFQTIKYHTSFVIPFTLRVKKNISLGIFTF